VFCPRCGAESEEGARYCASCGSELPRKEPDPEFPGEDSGDWGEKRPWFSRLIGTTPTARLVTLGTAVAIVIAVIAFIALKPDEDTVPQDTYNKALDLNCVQHKKALAAAQRQALAAPGPNAAVRFADALVPIAGEWRDELDNATIPADRRLLVEELEAALLEVQIKAGTLARVARESSPKQTVRSAEAVDIASQQVEGAVEALELERCELLTVQVGSLVQR
jgi:hypothetical protein